LLSCSLVSAKDQADDPPIHSEDAYSKEVAIDLCRKFVTEAGHRSARPYRRRAASRTCRSSRLINSVTRGWPSPPTAKQSPGAYCSAIDSSLTKIALPRGAVAAASSSADRIRLSSCGLIGASSLQAPPQSRCARRKIGLAQGEA